MFVPEPVISLALKLNGKETPNFARALNRFKKEDPTFRVHLDQESKEACISLYIDNQAVAHPLADYHLRHGRIASRDLRRANAAGVQC